MKIEIRIINTEIAIDIVRNRSSKELGRGTIIIAKIATIKPTIVRSFALAIVSSNGMAF